MQENNITNFAIERQDGGISSKLMILPHSSCRQIPTEHNPSRASSPFAKLPLWAAEKPFQGLIPILTAPLASHRKTVTYKAKKPTPFAKCHIVA